MSLTCRTKMSQNLHFSRHLLKMISIEISITLPSLTLNISPGKMVVGERIRLPFGILCRLSGAVSLLVWRRVRSNCLTRRVGMILRSRLTTLDGPNATFIFQDLPAKTFGWEWTGAIKLPILGESNLMLKCMVILRDFPWKLVHCLGWCHISWMLVEVYNGCSKTLGESHPYTCLVACCRWVWQRACETGGIRKRKHNIQRLVQFYLLV